MQRGEAKHYDEDTQMDDLSLLEHEGGHWSQKPGAMVIVGKLNFDDRLSLPLQGLSAV